MSLDPSTAVSGLGLGRREVRLAVPLVPRQQERLREEVLLAPDVLGDGVGAAVATAESGPLLRAQLPAAVATIRIGTWEDNSHIGFIFKTTRA